MKRYLTYITLFILLTLLSGNSFADEVGNRQLISDAAGFTISLQQVEQPLLLLELQQLQQELWDQQINMLTQLADMSFSAIDTIITIVLPGGLLYAFNKKLNHRQAQADLSELNGTLLQLQADISHMQIAQL